MIGTVYGIKDKRDGRIVYVGSTTKAVYVRWGQHLAVCGLKPKYPQRISIHLLENGPLNFEPVVLEELICTGGKYSLKLRECEQQWMDKYENLVNENRASGCATWSCICGLRRGVQQSPEGPHAIQET